MPDSDVQFTFDAAGFQDAINHMSGQMDKMNQTLEKGSEKMSSKVASGIGKFALIAGAAVGAFKIASSAIKNFVPEIGSTFSIVGKVIGKNLLWPLRQQLIPILQKVLNWVTANRKLFVQFGMVLVNVFKFIKVTFQTLFKLFDPIIRRVKGLLKSIFGDTASSITETINLVIFKLTTLMIALEVMLKPLFESIGNLMDGVIVAVKNFGQGFVAGFKNIFDPLEELNNLTADLSDTLDEMGKALEFLAPAFKVLGQVIGTIVGSNIKLLILGLQTTLKLMTALFKVIQDPKKAGDIASGALDDLASLYKTFGTDVFDAVKKTGGEIGNTIKGESVQDAIITKDGKVIRTSPEDNIIATKGMPGSQKVEINLSMAGANFSVTEGNARSAGENFGSGLIDKIKDALVTQRVLVGVN